MLRVYLTKISKTARQGDAREESFYPALEGLLSEFALSINKKDSRVTVLPKKTDAGNPDFRIWDGRSKIVGYIEAKAPPSNLDDFEKTEQICRYSSTFPNFILTNFIEFRLYKNGEFVEKVRVSDPQLLYNLKAILPVEKEKEFNNLMEKFFSFSLPSITTTDKLAIELAKRTRFLRDEVVAEEIEEEEKSGVKKILGFYDAFQTYLIRGLTREQFADLYSQTITYGLFASRMRGENDFNRKMAVYDIPHTIGILRELFEFISLGDLPHQMEWIVDEISNVLANVDVKGIFTEYFKTKKGGDPVFPFYETFLAEYDPEQREKRGVYYTPEPVVSYIVRSLNLILKEEFSLADGLADKSVTILDPAGGTLTFLAKAVREATKEFVEKYGEGGKDKFIAEHILRDFYAFELLIAPYAIGHLKMSFLLEEMGHRLQKEERLKFYLTNTLEMEEIEQTSLPGMASLSEESHFAGMVKKDIPILIILGNPPYSGHSENVGQWISAQVKDYYKVDGKPLGEKNTKWLQDDYVKFIRFAQWKIDQFGKGVIGFITNHAYLDSPTFRGMRQSLLNSFDEIRLLNLHGNSSRKERCPDGGKDENVFDIQQGVAIALFIKKDKEHQKTDIRYADLWGLRKYKYDWLTKNDVKTTVWTELQPHSEEYLFVPRDETLIKRYQSYTIITDIFQVGSIGVQTHRDNFVVDFNADSLKQKIRVFLDTKLSDDAVCSSLGLKETRSWKIKETRANLREDKNWESRIVEFSFRPFDTRWVFYHEKVIDRDRWAVMRHMMLPYNIGLNCMREFAYEVSSYNYAFVTDKITNDRIFISNKGAAYFFPLWLLLNPSDDRILVPKNRAGKLPNINATVKEILEKTYKKEITPEEILYYVYAVLFSEIYRRKYSDFFKTSFPRVPFTQNPKLFLRMSQLGKELVELHLMKSGLLNSPITKFEGQGDYLVKKPEYNDKTLRVYINENQFFDGLRPEVWNFEVGGYQVMFQWLKERRNCFLSLEEIRQYCKVATSVSRTIELQMIIDEIYNDIEQEIIEFKEKYTTSLENHT